MKRVSLLVCVLLAATLALSTQAWGQGSVSTGPPTAVNGLGQPLPGALVAVCTADPGATPTPPCATLATTYTDITLGTACSGAAATKPLSNPGGAGSTCSNPGFVDSKGNVLAYAAAGTYWCEYYGRGITTYVVPCIFPGTGSGGGSVGPGTLNHLSKFTSATTIGDAVCTDDGVTPTACGLGLSLVTNALYIVKTNNPSTGTTVNLLVARDSLGRAIKAQPTDTNNLIGISGFNSGITGSVSIATYGQFPCIFDNQTAIADWVILGSGSQCHDAGATEPSGVQNIGRVASVNGGAGTLATVDMGLPDVTNNSAGVGTGVVSPCTVTGAIAYYAVVGNTVVCDPLFITDGAGNAGLVSATFSGSSAGFVAFGQGTAPTMGAGTSAYIYAPASVPTTYGTALPSSPGTAGQVLTIATVPDATHITTAWSSSSSKRVCMMVFGADNGSALANADIGPQTEQCQIPYAATIYEIDITADAGTPSVIVGKRHCTANPCASNFTVTNLLSGALSTAASGGPACSKTGATAGLDTFTTCSATLQNTSIAIGDYIETVSATAGGTAKRFTVAVHFTVN